MSLNPITMVGNNSGKFWMRSKSASWVRGIAFRVFCSRLTVHAVNNVGKSHVHPVYFAESEPSELSDIIAINVDATVRITRMVLPKMVKRYVLVLLLTQPPCTHLAPGKTD